MDIAKLFKMALVMQGMTFHNFGSLHGVSRQFVSQVVAGKMSSPRIEHAINEFIHSNLPLISNTIEKYSNAIKA